MAALFLVKLAPSSAPAHCIVKITDAAPLACTFQVLCTLLAAVTPLMAVLLTLAVKLTAAIEFKIVSGL